MKRAAGKHAAEKRAYVVVSGLTRRLVRADDPRAARVIFLRDVPRGHLLKVPYDACRVYEASEQDVLNFRKKGRKATFDDQLALPLDLGDERPRNRAGPEKNKEPWGRYA